MKPKIAMFHALARSGGTLISRCIGCMSGNIVLSEIHHRWALTNPLVQSHKWFGLISSDELDALKSSRQINYPDAINLIHSRCSENNKHLIIRDWTHIDFTPGYMYPVPPVYYLSQYKLLSESFDIKHIAITRDPVDAYLSVSRVDQLRDWITLPTYLAGYRKFAEIAVKIGFVRYEDFCTNPLTSMATICNTLNIAYDAGFLEKFHKYEKVTGEFYKPDQPHTMTGDPIGHRSTPGRIEMPRRRPEYVSLLDELRDSEDYLYITNTLGYKPAWENEA